MNTATQFIDNDEADNAVLNAQVIHDSQSFQAVMDLISGVSGYRPYDASRQGSVGRVIMKEMARTPNLEDFMELVSVFWFAVTENLKRTAPVGQSV